jgi:hypothetical protein
MSDNPYTTSSTPPPMHASAQPTDATGGLIPYKNPKALVSYYLGVFSLIPVLGFFLGIAAIILGIQGLGVKKREPSRKGTAHAWVGITLGSIVVIIHTLVIVVMVIAGTRAK